ncbi:MAG: zf-TFIIB domain-containing protein [Candidatus Woesearchaeota archaeon]
MCFNIKNIFKKNEKNKNEFSIKNKNHENEKILKCPKCNIYMKKIKKNGIIIDVCDKCNGMWLDDKEIEKLLNYKEKIN